ncbi:hypothetical protein NY551_18865 [Curtobacterium flaccumfaciens pv. oortii]|uniref:hypothetical protein n=1 Tax=Curtobacterium flaccumfaciens TaxID=2035 RepID=UPI00265A8C37|nr:hypothetical protein [Curtobacterium flaccumfaciens]MCS5524802.1 hypothetical protein [Curtobacterium flaccumfaciens pv. oortii]
MTEYIYGAARALAAVDRDTEQAELPAPTEVKPRTLVRTSGGRTWLRVDSEHVGVHWREVTLVPRAELAHRRSRLFALVAMAIAALVWLVAIPHLPWLGVGNVGIPAFIGGVAAVIWWHLLLESDRDGLISAGRTVTDRAGVPLATAGDEPTTIPEPRSAAPEILAGGVIDPYEGLPRQLPLPRATTPGTVIRINGTIWRRWGTTWSPVHRLMTSQQERRQRVLDAVPLGAGIAFAIAGVLGSDLGIEARNALLLISEASLLIGFLAAGAARHRAELPTAHHAVAGGIAPSAQVHTNRHTTKDQ